MINTTKRAVAVLMPPLLIARMAAQTQRPRLTLVIRAALSKRLLFKCRAVLLWTCGTSHELRPLLG